ncbi:MAG: outer membrane protein transport protein [Candidatus Aminicenantaceae bacterium]
MLKITSILLLVAVLVMSAGYLSATVLTLYNVGPKAATMAGAFVGRADNTTAIFYNPAGLAFQKGLGFSVNVTYYNYTLEAGSEEPQSTNRSSEPQLIGSLFVAYTYKERISIGVGAFTPYSLVTKWPMHWSGNPLCFNSELKVFTLRPVLAIKINKYLSIGAGLDIVHSNVRWDFHNIHSTIWSYMECPINELNASGSGIGFTAGALFKPNDNFQIGARYQQRVNSDLWGKNNYRRGRVYIYNYDAPEHTPEVGTGKPEFKQRQRVVFSLPLPSEVVVGVMLAPAKRFTIQADVQRTGWSSFKMWEFVALIPEASFFPEPTDGEVMNDEFLLNGAREGIELNMKDTWSFKLGGEYYLKEELSLRIGYARHQSPLDEKNLTPVLPLLPRNVFSFGVGYDGPARSIATQSLIGNITFDAYVQYVMLEERTSSYPGYPLTFGGNYWVFGFGFGFYL